VSYPQYPQYPQQPPEQPPQPYGGVPTQPTQPNQPTQPGYPPPSDYPTQQGYPPPSDYPTQQGYPAQPGYGYPPPGQGPPPGYPPPAHYPPPVTTPQKGSKVGWIILFVILGLVVVCGGVIVGAIVWANRAVHNATTPTHAQVNQSARDGKLQFTVTGMACGKATEGNGSSTATANGQYCEVSLTVKNVGNDARVFAGAFQEAKDSDGNTYRDDAEAEAYANSLDQTFFHQINPGGEVKGVLIFDIPRDGKIVSLELHDSPLSAGVIVSVG
jgi:hypothetical protein